MLIDDDTINNFLNEILLKKKNVVKEIRIALNGLDAIQILAEAIACKDCPQLILLDINMPVMNSFEFLEEYKKNQFPEDIAIVMLTTSTNQNDITLSKEMSFNGLFINKPLTEDKIDLITEFASKKLSPESNQKE